MSKHTPGPWNYQRAGRSDAMMNTPGWNPKDPDQCGHRIYDSTSLVAALPNPMPWRDADATAANARLIAAAPELLESLEDLLSNLDEMGLATMPGDTFENMRETVDRARAAIAKAEGTP